MSSRMLPHTLYTHSLQSSRCITTMLNSINAFELYDPEPWPGFQSKWFKINRAKSTPLLKLDLIEKKEGPVQRGRTDRQTHRCYYLVNMVQLHNKITQIVLRISNMTDFNSVYPIQTTSLLLPQIVHGRFLTPHPRNVTDLSSWAGQLNQKK